MNPRISMVTARIMDGEHRREGLAEACAESRARLEMDEDALARADRDLDEDRAELAQLVAEEAAPPCPIVIVHVERAPAEKKAAKPAAKKPDRKRA